MINRPPPPFGDRLAAHRHEVRLPAPGEYERRRDVPGDPMDERPVACASALQAPSYAMPTRPASPAGSTSAISSMV